MKLDFDCDQWNIQKNEIKHGISPLETESIFFDKSLIIFDNLKHSNDKKKRWIAFGTSIKNQVLMTAFMIRKQKNRIISTRTASKNERSLYEKAKSKRNN
ncbi:MAG: BrnT family toxin [Melioribacteraceae bacterium]|nr:BrnT family toxin [Melioribacteraceae bacterium]MCF8412147.1 BrnT family toxin [Melioribacteraceae bacterium]MCF8432227.1 BrnT family toxin [Melioribacteraceae bacterium]